MKPRWRKVLSDLWDNKVRTLLVVLSISVGVFAVGMIAGAYFIIDNDMDQSYASGNPANVEIWTYAIDEEFLKTIERMPGVKTVEGRTVVTVRALSGNGSWLSIDLIGAPDFAESQINLLNPVQGNVYPADRELLIENRRFPDFYLSVGESLLVQLSDGTEKTLALTGVVQDQTTGAADYLSTPLGYINQDTLDWLHIDNRYNRLLVTVADDPNDREGIQQLANQVTDRLEKSGYPVYRTQINRTNVHPMASTVQAVLGVLGALGVLIVVLSSSLIANTLSALLNQHLRQIGVMKLIGGRTQQIIAMYMFLIVSFGLISLLIAIPLGGQAAYALSGLIASEMNFSLQGYRIIPTAVAFQAAIALIVPLVSGIFPVITGARIKVRKALAGPEEQGTTRGGIDRLMERVRWLPRPLLISLRNTFRRKGRLALTLFTLTLGGAIFIAVFNVRIGLNDYVNQLGKYFLADANLSFERAYRLDEIEQFALQVPGVRAIEGWAFASAEWQDEGGLAIDNIQILAPPVESALVDPMLIEGRWIQPGDENAITINEAILADHPDVQIGDRLTLEIANKHSEWVLVGVFKFVGTDSLIAYTSYEYLVDLMNQSGKAFSYRVVSDVHDIESQKQLSQTLDTYFRDQGFRVSEVSAGLSSLETASEGLGVLITFLLIMALLTALVGSIGLMGTMGMNVMERTREIGVMRAIGAVDRVIMISVIVEGMIIGLMSWVLGAALSFPISALLSNIISQAIFNTPIDFTFTILGFIIWIFFVLLLSTLASILPAYNAARLTIREVLAYE